MKNIGFICDEMAFDGLTQDNVNTLKEYSNQFLFLSSSIQYNGEPIDTSFNHSDDLNIKYDGLAKFYDSLKEREAKSFTITGKPVHILYRQLYDFIIQNENVIYFKPPKFIFSSKEDATEEILRELMAKLPNKHHIGIISTKCVASAYSKCIFTSFSRVIAAHKFDTAMNDARCVCNYVNQFIYVPDISTMRRRDILSDYHWKPFDHRAFFAMVEYSNLKKLDIRPQQPDDVEFLVSTALGIASNIEREYMATKIIIDKTDWSIIDNKAQNLTMRYLSKMEAIAGVRPNIFLLSNCMCGPLMATTFGCGATLITVAQS